MARLVELGAHAAQFRNYRSPLPGGAGHQQGEPCDVILLATGSVRAVDLKVRDVTHVNSKIERALEMIGKEVQGGRQVIVAVPAGNLSEIADHLHSQLTAAGISLLPVEDLGELTQRIGLRRPEFESQKGDGAALPAPPGAPGSSALYRPHVLAASAVFAIGVALFAARYFTVLPSAHPVVAESKLFDGFWMMAGQGHEPCPLKSWTAHIVVVGGWIPASKPEKGFVRPTGEFRFTSPARIDPSKTNEFMGRLFGATGKGEYRTIGGQCAGTFTMARVEN